MKSRTLLTALAMLVRLAASELCGDTVDRPQEVP